VYEENNEKKSKRDHFRMCSTKNNIFSKLLASRKDQEKSGKMNDEWNPRKF
jgi:hypothetical protein